MSKADVILDSLKKMLNDYSQSKKSVGNLSELFVKLHTATTDLAKLVKAQDKDKEASEKKTKENEDEFDDFQQKNLRAKFIISVTPEKPTPMKSSDQLAAEGGAPALATHIKKLAKDKYDVEIDEKDIASCHYLPRGGIFFSLWNLRPGSVFEQLTYNIKKGKGKKDINVFFNFMLTKRRSGLLYEVRKLKKEGQIARYYSDEEGIISIKVKESDNNMKLTSIYETKTSPVKTFRVPELLKRVAELQPQ